MGRLYTLSLCSSLFPLFLCFLTILNRPKMEATVMPRGLPIFENQVAGIVWGEAPHIVDLIGRRILNISNRTQMHRTAIAIVVVNRARQNLSWGTPGVQDTVVPVFPTTADLSRPEFVDKWLQCKQAAREAMALLRRSASLTDDCTLIGAQLYFHSWDRPQTTLRRFRSTGRSAEHVASYTGYDRNSRRYLWLNVHLDRLIRDNFVTGSVP